MREIDDDAWKRRGFTLLWSPAALGGICPDTRAILSLRTLFRWGGAWPDDLPSGGGMSAVVTGLEGCLDGLDPDGAQAWVEEDLRPLMVRFQTHYDGAALVLWLPTGDRRVHHDEVDDTFGWTMAPPFQRYPFPLSRSIFGGAHTNLRKIVVSGSSGREFIGLHLTRLA